jgi:hypothetical protein
MTTQNDINKDMVSLAGSLSDGINQLRKAVELLAHDLSSTISEINDLKSSQNIRNENFNDRLINLEENKIKVIDEELKRIDTLEQAFNREL